MSSQSLSAVSMLSLDVTIQFGETIPLLEDLNDAFITTGSLVDAAINRSNDVFMLVGTNIVLALFY